MTAGPLTAGPVALRAKAPDERSAAIGAEPRRRIGVGSAIAVVHTPVVVLLSVVV